MNLLYTVNIGDFVSKRARDSFLSACNRWDCDYAELIHKRIDGDCESATKLFGAANFLAFDKVLYLDGDTVISECAPNPFDLCISPKTLYVVSDYQAPNQCAGWEELAYERPLMRVKDGQSRHNDTPPLKRFFNSGFFMFQSGLEISAVFTWALAILPRHCSKFEEQAALNFAAHNGYDVKVEILPETWNHIIPKGEGPVADYYINHYAGWAQSLLTAP